jgi:hypothetical protein
MKLALKAIFQWTEQPRKKNLLTSKLDLELGRN